MVTEIHKHIALFLLLMTQQEHQKIASAHVSPKELKWDDLMLINIITYGAAFVYYFVATKYLLNDSGISLVLVPINQKALYIILFSYNVQYIVLYKNSNHIGLN